jgi:hypothetical protein
MAVLSQHIPNALLNLEQFETNIKQGVVEKRTREDHQSDIRSGVNGAPHGLCTTHKDQVNADLLAFFKA